MNTHRGLGTPGLKLLCRIVRGMAALGAAALAAVPLLFWFAASWARNSAADATGLAAHQITLGDSTLLQAGLAALVPVALGMYALLQLWPCSATSPRVAR